MAWGLGLLLSLALIRSAAGVLDGPELDTGSIPTAQERLEKEEPSPAKKGNGKEFSYTVVNGFVLEGNKGKAPNMEACQAKCDGKISCGSFSYRQRDGTCTLASKKLKFSVDWQMFVRGLTTDATGALVDSDKFHGFQGLFDDGFQHSEGVSREVCEESCTSHKRCKSYSYKKDGQACLLSAWNVKYDEEYKYYENKERTPTTPAIDKKTLHEMNKVTEAQSILGMNDQRARMKVVKKKDLQEKAFQKVEEQKRRIMAEANQKQKKKTDEFNAKAAHKKRIAEILESSTKRGEYAESVHKSADAVRENQVKFNKERRAKVVVTKKQAEHAATKAKEEEREASEERAVKKQRSLNGVTSERTEKETKYLHLREQAFEIHAKAVELVKEQRQVVDVEMPGDSNRAKQEKKLLNEKNVEKKQLQQLQGKLARNTHELSRKKEEFEQEWDVKKAAFNAETQSITKESKEKIIQAEVDAKRIKAKEKAEKLRVEADSPSVL